MSETPPLEIELPAEIRDVEPVQSIRTPIRLTYDYIPSAAAVASLTAYAEKRILGGVSPVDGAVFVPPRGVDPRHGVATTETVDLPDTGHIGSFCVTRLPIPGRDDLELPYVSAWIFLDGADVGFLGLVTGIDTSEVHIGMRVKALWKPDDQLGRTAENIVSWIPSGEPSLPFDEAGVRGYRKRSGATGSDPVA